MKPCWATVSQRTIFDCAFSAKILYLAAILGIHRSDAQVCPVTSSDLLTIRDLKVLARVAGGNTRQHDLLPSARWFG